ncbi:MAG: 30S ribosomal protein S16 [Candidatus Omnitrophica bacterium]|nr:30S ribosomal protein S16 [Candidatus Omnitrophota bacterium]
MGGVPVVVRLKRMGTLKKPHHKIVVAPSRRARDGAFLEEVGIYDPSKTPPLLKINKERVAYWAQHGAFVTPAVTRLLRLAA